MKGRVDAIGLAGRPCPSCGKILALGEYTYDGRGDWRHQPDDAPDHWFEQSDLDLPDTVTRFGGEEA